MKTIPLNNLILIPLKTIAMVLSDPESQNDFQGILNL